MDKNCIIVICDEISIIVRISYNDIYTNETAFHRNKEKSFILGQCIIHLVHDIAFILKIPKYPFLKCKVKLFIVVIFLYVDVRDGVKR